MAVLSKEDARRETRADVRSVWSVGADANAADENAASGHLAPHAARLAATTAVAMVASSKTGMTVTADTAVAMAAATHVLTTAVLPHVAMSAADMPVATADLLHMALWLRRRRRQRTRPNKGCGMALRKAGEGHEGRQDCENSRHRNSGSVMRELAR